MSAPTHYQILGVEPSATQEQIRRAYRAAAKSLHPDVSKALDAEKRFARVAAAYEVISNAARRREYDRALAAAAAASKPAAEVGRGHYTWSNTAAAPESTDTPDLSEVDDLFDTFFAATPRPSAAKTRRKPKPTRKRRS